MLKLIIKNSFMWITVFITTSFLGTWWATLVFMLSFMAIRYSFGGWHSKNEYVCFAISVFTSILAGYISKTASINVMIYIPTYLFAFIVARKVGVVDNPTKRLSTEKKIRFKRRGLLILTTLFCINILLLTLSFTSLSNAVLIGVLVSFTNLLFGK